jgi:hypothetical protein
MYMHSQRCIGQSKKLKGSKAAATRCAASDCPLDFQYPLRLRCPHLEGQQLLLHRRHAPAQGGQLQLELAQHLGHAVRAGVGAGLPRLEAPEAVVAATADRGRGGPAVQGEVWDVCVSAAHQGEGC